MNTDTHGENQSEWHRVVGREVFQAWLRTIRAQGNDF
jgi:hypothetical protein